MSALDHKRITPAGKSLGAQMAVLVEKPIAVLAAEGEPDERCKSCAFRLGTVPNGCIQTQLDVYKAVVEDVPFMCHAKHDDNGNLSHICHGWFAVRNGLRRRGVTGKIATMPYDFSPPDEERK